MAELTLKDGRKKIVSYNMAAKIYQAQHGNILASDVKEREMVSKLAKSVVRIDFKKNPRQRRDQCP